MDFRGKMFGAVLVASMVMAGSVQLAVAGEELGAKPGPAFTMVDGKVIGIEGNVYTVESESTNYQNLGTSVNKKQFKILVSEETKKLHGKKKVGDKIRAEVTEDGFANSIQ